MFFSIFCLLEAYPAKWCPKWSFFDDFLAIILMRFWLPHMKGPSPRESSKLRFLLLFGNVLRLPHSVSIDLLDQKRGTWGTLPIREWVNQQMYENVQNPSTKSQETLRSPRGKSALSRGRGTPRTPIHQGKKRLLQGTRNSPPPSPPLSTTTTTTTSPNRLLQLKNWFLLPWGGLPVCIALYYIVLLYLIATRIPPGPYALIF